jgi:hypothetical protein
MYFTMEAMQKAESGKIRPLVSEMGKGYDTTTYPLTPGFHIAAVDRPPE